MGAKSTTPRARSTLSLSSRPTTIPNDNGLKIGLHNASSFRRGVKKLSILIKGSTVCELTAQRINRTIRPCSEGCQDDGLFTAVDRGHRACVMQLLASGADPYNENDIGATPFHLSVKNADLLEIFLEVGCHVSRRTRFGEIMTATSPARQRVAGWTPLHFAADSGYADSIEVLIEYGAEADARDVMNITPMMIASDRGHKECVGVLIKANMEHYKNGMAWVQKRFLAACLIGDLEMMNILLEAGAKPSCPDLYDGMTPLMTAAKMEQADVVTLLLECNVDVYCHDKLSKKTALDYALETGNDVIVGMLQSWKSNRSASLSSEADDDDSENIAGSDKVMAGPVDVVVTVDITDIDNDMFPDCSSNELELCEAAGTNIGKTELVACGTDVFLQTVL